MNTRVEVQDHEITAAIQLMAENLTRRVREKGRGSFISDLEIDGSIDQELREVKAAIHQKDRKAVVDELLDLAVGSVFGVASLMAITRKEKEAATAQAPRPAS